MTRITQISKKDMEPVLAIRAKAMEAAGIAEKALKDARLAELEFKVQIQQLYLVNGLDPNCRLDIANGAVVWPDTIAEEEGPDNKEAPKQEKQPKKRGKKTAKAEVAKVAVEPTEEE
jgi:ribosomal protein L3